MKLKSHFGYWIASAILLLFSVYTLICQWTLDINPNVHGEYGSYYGFLLGLWKGDEGLDFRDISFGRAAYLISDLITPYLLLGFGLWLGIIAFRRQKFNRAIVYGSRIELSDSSSDMNSETVWPPPI